MSEMPSIGQFCWNELSTTDPKKANEFYGKLFGWEFEEHPMGDMNYIMVKIKGKKASAGIWAIPKEMQSQIPPHWMSYILVESLEDSIEKVTKLGGKIVRPATEAGDFGRFAIITDPTGAMIAIWENKPH